MAKRRKPAGWHTTVSVNMRDPKTGESKLVKVQLEVDWVSLAYRLGVKAIRNGNRKSRLAVGVVATIIGEGV